MMNLRTTEGLREFASENKGRIAFLRFNRGGLVQQPLSDWDIAVRDTPKTMGSCEKLFGKPWLRIPRRYVIQHFYEWGQVDLLPRFEWNGIQYLEPAKFWEGVTEGEDGIPRPVLAHDAFVAWMTGILWGGRFNDRYEEFVKAGAVDDAAVFRECLDSAFGEGMAGRLMEMAVEGRAGDATGLTGKLRSKLRRRRLLSRPFKTLGHIFGHWVCEFCFHIKPPYPWIGILGPDGSGKSSIIAALEARLQVSRIKIHSIHWAPQFKGKVEDAPMVVTDPHARPPKSALLSILQLGKIVLAWWVAIVRNLLHLRAKQAIVLSDRFYPDLLADPRRYRYGASLIFARLAFRLIPRPDRVFVLITDAETILKRKQEVEPAELERQLEAYREIASRWQGRAVLIDCGMELEKVVEKVADVLLRSLEERSR